MTRLGKRPQTNYIFPLKYSNQAPTGFITDMRIEICGGVASGKTTVGTLTARIDWLPVFEDFRNNPFWKSFYTDRTGVAFEAEICFLLQHYHDIKTATKKAGNVACDFSLLLDLAYSDVTLNRGKRSAFSVLYREIRKELPNPDLFIHLVCDPEIELERIRLRGRHVEQSITVDYLAAINRALADVIRKEANSWNVLAINSAALDFANVEQDKQTVLECVEDRLGANIDK